MKQPFILHKILKIDIQGSELRTVLIRMYGYGYEFLLAIPVIIISLGAILWISVGLLQDVFILGVIIGITIKYWHDRTSQLRDDIKRYERP